MEKNTIKQLVSEQPEIGTSLKMNVWTILDVAMRALPIFLMDKTLKYKFRGLDGIGKFETVSEILALNNDTENYLEHPWITICVIVKYALAYLELLLYIQVFCIAMFVFIFNTKQLLTVYIRIASVGIVVVAYEINMDFLYYNSKIESYSPSNYQAIFITNQLLFTAKTYFFQLILALLFSFINSIPLYSQGIIIISFFVPTLSHTLGYPEEIHKVTPILTAITFTGLLSCSILIHGFTVCETIYRGIKWYHHIDNYALYTSIGTHWINLNIPHVFGAFWIIKISEYFLHTINKDASCTLADILRNIIIHGSENIVALFGMASIVSMLSQFLGNIIQKFLHISDTSESNIGNISAILFLLLSLQTGITYLTPEERYNRISHNFCVLYTALLHFTFNRLDPILTSLGASRNPCVTKHLRALTVISLLIMTPAIILVYEWKTEEPTTWLFTLTSFMLELIVKTIVLIAIYILLIIDAYKDGLWENLDDYVYYLKGASSLTEFLLGIYLLINGFWIFIFESTGAIRACMMCLHAYFNIWCQGKKGWESFLHHRSSQQKINFLQEASDKQLEENNICAICFQTLKYARVTQCNHFFHGVCLRKWLNVQDTCPLCHATLH